MKINPQLQIDLNYIHKNFDKKKIFKNKNVLITGFNGFIGYELSRYLIYFKKELKINFLYLTDINFKKFRINDNKIIFKNLMWLIKILKVFPKKKYI